MRDTLEALQTDVNDRDREIESSNSRFKEVQDLLQSSESKRILLQTEYDGLLHEVNNLRKSRDGAEKVVTQLESKI